MNKETIRILHTNDVHSHFTYWPQMARFIQQQRQETRMHGEELIVVDLGDHIDRSNFFTEATLGKGNVTLLNEAGYDIVTIGNNEGITLDHDDLKTLYDGASFEVIVGNLESKNQLNPSWLKRSTIYTTAQGTKIGFVSATADFRVFYDKLGWETTEPRQAIIEEAAALQPHVDFIVCLSHLGRYEDELLAQECPELTVIFGAHTHHVFLHGEVHHGVLLTGGGKYGQYIGELTLQYDEAQRKIVYRNTRLLDCSQLPKEQDDAAFEVALIEEARKQQHEPLFHLPKFLNKEWYHHSQLSRFFAEALFAQIEGDCAMFHAGIFKDDLHAGDVTAYDLHRILPHPINVCVVELSGAQLKEAYLQSFNDEWPRKEMKGLGFRGVVLGKMLHYNMSLNTYHELEVNGQVVNPKKHYKLITLDMYTFGFFFPSFKYAPKEYILPYFLRDIFKHYAQKIFI